MKKVVVILLSVVLAFTLAACSSNSEVSPSPSITETPLSGNIEIDGSSTVYPLSEAISEEFGKEYADVKVTVGVSGTGGGFKRFCAGETAISNASRPIKAEEVELCKAKNIEYIELAVAYDGLSVVIHKDNDWATTMTVSELKSVFTDASKKTWKDVNAAWPNEKIEIFSPGTDSGTFDYFNEAIVGKEATYRNDDQLSLSEDDNVLVQGVSGNKYAIGYFGYSYYQENEGKLGVVAIDAGKGAGPIVPNETTINDGSYSPLSRVLYIYVTKTAFEKPEVKEYVTYFLENSKMMTAEVGFIALPDAMYTEGLAKLK